MKCSRARGRAALVPGEMHKCGRRSPASKLPRAELRAGFPVRICRLMGCGREVRRRAPTVARSSTGRRHAILVPASFRSPVLAAERAGARLLPSGIAAIPGRRTTDLVWACSWTTGRTITFHILPAALGSSFDLSGSLPVPGPRPARLARVLGRALIERAQTARFQPRNRILPERSMCWSVQLAQAPTLRTPGGRRWTRPGP